MNEPSNFCRIHRCGLCGLNLNFFKINPRRAPPKSLFLRRLNSQANIVPFIKADKKSASSQAF
jgi:hypothetical protein